MKHNSFVQYYQKFQRHQIRNFAANYNKQKLHSKLTKNKAKIILINKGIYDYAYFNFAFVNNMISLILEVIYKGYFPVIQLDNRKKHWTNWDTFFEQPFGTKLCEKYEKYNMEIGTIIAGFRTPYNVKELQIWSKLYNDFIILNADTQIYVEKEYENLLKNKKVLGVLCRGTDYIHKRPYGHPIQPEIDDVIEVSRIKMNELNLDFIYLATEEYGIYKQFEEAFPQKIIINKRFFYDESFYTNQYDYIYQIHGDHENEIYIRGLEYLSSICLLSRCDALIAGNTGGSTAALYLNNGKYCYWKLFDLGFYGINDKK
ncbi:MAG: hypothetical protein FWF72_05200 [Paludibacter sp.]|nr:hypothetical protein [Paludibacter sp.]